MLFSNINENDIEIISQFKKQNKIYIELKIKKQRY